MVAPVYTPALQLKDWYTKGMVVARRPPKMKALMGTPSGFPSQGQLWGIARQEP